MNDFRHGSAAGAVRDATPVAEADDLFDHAGRDDEVSAHLDVERSRRGVQDGAGAEGHLRAFRPDEGHERLEHLVGAVAAVGKLERADAAVIAGLDDLLRQFDVLVVEHRHDPGRPDQPDGIDFLELCHNSQCFERQMAGMECR